MDGILTCWQPVRVPVIAAAQKCQIIGRCGIGLDNIDVEAATEHGIVVIDVTNVPAYCIDEVSDHAMGLLLRVPENPALRSGYQGRAHGNRTSDQRCAESGAKRSVSSDSDGFARSIVPKAKAFGFTINICSPRTDPELIQQHGAQKVSFSELLATSDFITIHAPSTPETQGMFSEAEFGR